MADPFSAASSAISVISLGLQIAQQLITFCQAYQSYDEDAKRIESKAESLRRPLRALRNIIEDAQVSNPELASDLSEKALGLQRMVNRLGIAVERHLPAIADGFPEKIRGQIKRVVYPFRRDRLREMFEDLDGIQNALQTTLSIHSTQKMTQLGLMQEAILEEVQQIRITLQEYPEGMPPPALLKSWCDSQRGFENGSVAETQITTVTSSSEFASFTTSSDDAGHELLPYNPKYANKQEITTAKSFKYLSSFLRVAVTASFSLSKGAGGLSIAPCLKLQTMVAFDGSPLDSMLAQLCASKLHSNIQFDRRVDICIRQVQEAFSCGNAAPSDIYYYSYTPADYNMVSFVDALVPFDMASSRDGFSSLDKLTRFLVSSGSVPNNKFSQGALRGLLRFKMFQEKEYTLASYLVDHGGPCVMDTGVLNHIERHNVKYILSRDKEIIVVPEVARIIFQESEEKLLLGLRSGRILANDEVCGCPLLQLAFGWPRGMKILLNGGATVGGKPLLSFWGCPSPLTEENVGFDGFYHSTKLLLEVGCRLNITELRAASPKLLSLFVNEIANRRRRLWKLAQSSLPQYELHALNIPETAVPDRQAASICAALAAHGKTVDSSLVVKRGYVSVYDDLTLQPSVMEELFKVGFKDIDSPNSLGVTPLMHAYNSYVGGWEGVERMAWFLSKGADINRRLPLSNAKTGHLITAQVVGFFLGILEFQKPDDIYSSWIRWERKISKHRDSLFPNQSITDSCSCACCPHGCTILSVALRQVLGWQYWFQVSEPDFWLRRLLGFITGWENRDPIIESSVIRCLTFDALGLKHTCCIELGGVFGSLKRKSADEMEGRDDEEIGEIRQESRNDIAFLEKLMLEFEATFDELGLPLIEFLEGYWHTRMVQHVLERDPYDEKHDREARSIGVILQAEEADFDRVSLLIRAGIKDVVDDDGWMYYRRST